MMIMKLLLSVFALLVSALGIHAANPAFQDFFGTNGIIIQTNGNKVQVRAATTVVTNILGSGSVLVTSNNLGTYTVLGLATNGVTNIVILTNGVALGTPSALNFIYPVTGLLSGATADIGVNSAAVTTGTVANANIWTNQNGRIRPIVYPTFRIYPTNDDAGSPILIMGGAGASNWMAAGYGGTLRDYSLFSANIVEEGDLNNRNLAVASAQDTGGARYGYAAFETKTNQSMVFTETLITGEGVNRFIAGHVDGTGNVITLVTNTTEAFKVDGVGGISLMKGIAQNWPDAQGAAGTVLTNDGFGNLGWGAGGGAGGATINPTDDYLPFRLNATTFSNSPLVRLQTNRLGFGITNSVLFYDSPANNLGFGEMVMTTVGSSANNTILGSKSGTNLTGTANANTLVGSAVAPDISSGDNNVGVGRLALNALTTGNDNIGIGAFSMQSLIAGIDNTAVGRSALDNITGSENTALGRAAGSTMVGDGKQNTFIGAYSDTFASRTNSTALGYGSLITSNNQVVFGSGVSNYQFRAVNYIFPRTQGAAGTVLTNDGGGTLGWGTAGGGATDPAGADKSVQYNSSGSFGGDGAFLWESNSYSLVLTGAIPSLTLIDHNQGYSNKLTPTSLKALSGSDIIFGMGGTNQIKISSAIPHQGSIMPVDGNRFDAGSQELPFRSNGVMNAWVSNTFVFLGGTLGAGKVLIDPLGNGSATWGTNVSSLLVTNLTVVNEFKGPVTFQTNVFITNLFLGGVEIRTNQYTTNISHTPVLGSFWFQGTNGIPVTNNARVSMEWIPVMRSWRLGEIADGIHPSNLGGRGTNYWNATNVGVLTFAHGSNVMAKANFSSIGGGRVNLILTNSDNSVIGGGYNNFIDTNSHSSTIGGGGKNEMYGRPTAFDNVNRTISGGSNNVINGLITRNATIGGGQDNAITTDAVGGATVAGGVANLIRIGGSYGFIGGGNQNTIDDNAVAGESEGAVIAGGIQNVSRGLFSFIGGGKANNLLAGDSDGSVIVGGSSNTVGIAAGDNESKYASIVGGFQNSMAQNATFSFIGGGLLNTMGGNNTNSVIGGGFQNEVQANAQLASVLSGKQNIIDGNGDFGLITGGVSNNIGAAMSTAAGNFITNTTASSVEIGHGAAGGNNRKARVDVNGLKVLTYGGHAAAVGGTILVTNTPIASAGAAETNLQVVTIGAHVLTNNNERLLVRASGRFAATSNAKEVKLVFGSQEVFASGSQVANTGAWTLDAEIIRTGNTSQSVNASFHGGTNTAFITESSLDLAQTNGIATVLKITGTAAGDADITNRTLTVEWRPAP